MTPASRPAKVDEAVRRALTTLRCVSGGDDEWWSCLTPTGNAVCVAFQAQQKAHGCRAERGALSHATPEQLAHDAMFLLGCKEDAQRANEWLCTKEAASGMAACEAFKAKGTVAGCRQDH
jgi:hypothetical protein